MLILRTGTLIFSKDYLHLDEVDLVSTIYLPRQDVEDEYIWIYTKNTEYSVKSGYWVATHMILDNTRIRLRWEIMILRWPFGSYILTVKYNTFLWRIITGSLSTATRLITRNVNMDPICQWCCLDEESINHVLFLCPHAQNIWRCSSIPSLNLQQPSANLEDNLDYYYCFTALHTYPLNYGCYLFGLLGIFGRIVMISF